MKFDMLNMKITFCDYFDTLIIVSINDTLLCVSLTMLMKTKNANKLYKLICYYSSCIKIAWYMHYTKLISI